LRGDDHAVLIRQKESDLLAKLANMLRAEEQRPEGERDHELIATINRTIENLKTAKETARCGSCEIDGHWLPFSALIYAYMFELIASKMQSVISIMS
jgi:hypothetical protein